MLAMLRHVVYEGLRTRRVRPTWFIQSARNTASRAFRDEVAALVAASEGKVRALSVIAAPEPDKQIGVDFDVQGRIDMDLLKRTLPFDDFDFYLCGPPVFMQAVYDGLRGLRVPNERIFAEAFGPASLQRTTDGPAAPAGPKPATTPVPVAFAKSAKEARWSPGDGFLLDLAESRGLAPEYSCRSGSCGTCRTKILEGKVAYPSPPSANIGADEALICCAVPAEGADRLILDV
jgi:ferredoxin-NADP reductase